MLTYQIRSNEQVKQNHPEEYLFRLVAIKEKICHFYRVEGEIIFSSLDEAGTCLVLNRTNEM